MKAHCTYCSAKKVKSEKPLAAIELYESHRIRTISLSARKNGTEFLILSGKYGILKAHQKIDYYDHLLTQVEVEKHVALVAAQLKTLNLSSIIFYSSSPEQDKNVRPYISSIIAASEKAGIQLSIELGSYYD